MIENNKCFNYCYLQKRKTREQTIEKSERLNLLVSGKLINKIE